MMYTQTFSTLLVKRCTTTYTVLKLLRVQTVVEKESTKS
jgi:hypothetical protein